MKPGDEGELEWNEFEVRDSVNIPYADLSAYSGNFQQEIIKTLVETKYMKNYYREGSVLYRIYLLKLNEREYFLIAPFDHLIFDGMSAEIIIESITAYAGKPAERPINQFKDYVDQIGKGPQNIAETDLISNLNLARYKESLREAEQVILKKSDDTLTEYLFKTDYSDLGIEEKSVFEYVLQTVVSLCSHIFNLRNIPLKFVYFARDYENRNFYNTVGEFIDIIPVSLETGQPANAYAACVEKYMDFIRKHNINITSLVNNHSLKEKWKEIIMHILPEKISPLDNMILFNFHGKQAERTKMGYLYEIVEAIKEQRKEKEKHASFSIDSYFDDKSVYFSIVTTLGISNK